MPQRYQSDMTPVLLNGLQRQELLDQENQRESDLQMFVDVPKETINSGQLKDCEIVDSLKIFCFDSCEATSGNGSTRKGSSSGSEDHKEATAKEDLDYTSELKQMPFISNWLCQEETD